MRSGPTISFGDFNLDPNARQLRYRGEVRPLRSKSFAVLWYLASNAGRLVPQQELMSAVWGRTSVGGAVVRISIREIRVALGDAAHRLVTVPRQGHRFVLDREDDARTRPFVGREAELSALHHAWLGACAGTRHVVFVTGEAGIGKSALVGRFLDEIRVAGNARIVSGQCVEVHDSLEPYAPLLDLLGRACRAPGGEEFEQAAARWAPSWLRRLADRGEDVAGHHAELRPVPRSAALLRELSTLLETFCAETPLVVELEDLHWADASTLAALAHLGQRDVPAALLIVCTRRPAFGAHPERLDEVRRQLLARNRCSELALGMLDAAQVEQLLTRRLPLAPLGRGVAETLHVRTGGHPLFLTAMTDHLVAHRQLVADEGAWRLTGTLNGVIPTAIRDMIAMGFQTLTPEQRRILDAASVAGTTFSSAAIAAALDLSIGDVEDACDQLVVERRLVHGGIEDWPDGTTSARYSFVHAMHAEVLYGGLGAGLRSRYHRLVAERVSRAHEGHLRDVAAILAHHFTLAGDDERAWYAHRQAALAARDCLAAREAIGHLEAALTMIGALPEDEKRAAVELRCLLELGESTIAVHGYTDPAVVVTYRRACVLANETRDVASHVLAESGLFLHHLLRGDLDTAHERAREILRIADRMPMLVGTGFGTLGMVLLSRGDIPAAHDAFTSATDAWRKAPGVARDLSAMLHGLRANCRVVLGRFREAQDDLAEMLARIEELPFDPLLVAQGHVIAAYVHVSRGAPGDALRHAEQAIALADEHGVPLSMSPRIARGWATQDPAAIRDEMAALARADAGLGAPEFGALLADVLLRSEDGAAASAALERAFAAAKNGEEYFLAEMHRLHGRCLILGAAATTTAESRTLVHQAKESFELAVATAVRQGARLWLLRAATDACAVALSDAPARDRLRDVLAELDDGSDAPDLRRARALLAGA